MCKIGGGLAYREFFPKDEECISMADSEKPSQLLDEAKPHPDSPDIQGSMIRALHPESAKADDSEPDEELLARMQRDSKGFADMVCQGFERMERSSGL